MGLINTEPLTQADIDALNAAVRAAEVTPADVKSIANEFNLGEGTVRRWFDTTNGGRYSPCISSEAVGVEAYGMQNFPEREGEFSPEGWEDYGNYGVDDYDDDADFGGGNPPQENLFNRLLLAGLLSGGYSREVSTKSETPENRTTFTGMEKHSAPTFPNIMAAFQEAKDIISGDRTRFDAKAWASIQMFYNPLTDEWYLDYEYCDRDDDDGSP